MRTYLVVGASRGIGLALVKEILNDCNNYVIATVRDIHRAQALRDLEENNPSRLRIIEFDVTDFDAVGRAASQAVTLLPEGSGIDCLIHSAAVDLQEVTPFEEVDLSTFQTELTTNLIAPLHTVVFVTSLLGSIQEAPNWAGLSETYSVTKAGLGMLARKWGTSLRAEGICTVLLDPGYVNTDMGNSIKAWMTEHAPHMTMLSPDESAAHCLKVIQDARIEDAVLYNTYDGSIIRW